MASNSESTWNFFVSLTQRAWHLVASLYRLLAWSIVRWGKDGPDVNMLAGQVLGMRLLGPAAGRPGRLKPGLV